jgi:hypothetical protein
MDEAECTAAAERLARPCVFLKRFGSPDSLAGVWGGSGIVPAPDGPYRHWLSIDCRFLPPGLGVASGILSVYTNEDDCASGVVSHGPSAALGGTVVAPLYAHSARSLPPPDALAAEGDPAYMQLWQANCPLYTGQAAAVLGGWHFPWPDGDWEDLRNCPLLVWTLDESEPWVEVWGGPAGFRVIQRIT